MQFNLAKSLTTFGILALVLVAKSPAQTLTNGTLIENVNSIVLGSNPYDEGYFFPGTTGTPASQYAPPAYASIFSQNAFNYPSNNSTLKIGDGTDAPQTVQTGGYFVNPSTSYGGIIAIALGANTPAKFTLNLLTDNTGFADTYYQVSLFNSTTNTQIGSTLQVNSTVTGRESDNDFYSFIVAGGAGDYVQISGLSSTANYANLGGIVFSTAPEPATYGMMLVGLGMLVSLARLRQLKV